jgi:hypothetical protein
LRSFAKLIDQIGAIHPRPIIVTAIDDGYWVHRGRESGTAETPDDAAFELRTGCNKLSNVICAAVGDRRGKSVVAILGRYEIVAAIVQQLHGATDA